MPEQTTMPMKREDAAPRRWDPFEMFETLQEEMDRIWRRPGPLWAGAFPSFFRRAAGQGMTWVPRMDVYEKDNALVVKADLPGLKKEDVQVELDDGGLVIRGSSKTESEVKEEDYYRMERSVGIFYRRLPLPFEVKADQIQATLRDGVLEVRIPRPAEKTEAKKITVAWRVVRGRSETTQSTTDPTPLWRSAVSDMERRPRRSYGVMDLVWA